MSRKLTTKEFIEKAQQVHGNKYDYSKVDYQGSKIKVTIICPEHGEFQQRPNDHLNGYGCAKCANNIKYTNEEWINIAKKKFSDIDYSKVNYQGATIPVILICPKHGEFTLAPNAFFNNIKGCPKCGIELNASTKSFTTEEWITKAREVHRNKYDYSKVNYINSQTKVIIICPEHGEFIQLANSHLQGSGCPECNKDYLSKLFRKTTQQFIEEANQIHQDKYDYNKVEYDGKDKKVEIICFEHGSFWQTPHAHLSGQGCPKCNQSHGENMIEKYLKDHNLQYMAQKICYLDTNVRKTNKIVLDFVVLFNKRPYIIEYHGKQHYEYTPIFHSSEEDFKIQQRRDKVLRNRCLFRGFPLIEIPYTVKTEEEIIKILDSYFSDEPTYIYTDGAFSRKRNSGGWGIAEVKNNNLLYYSSNKVNNTSNNRMELMAVIRALHHCLKQHINNCIILSDSQYVIGCGTQGWNKNKNFDLWEIFDKLLKKVKDRNYNIEFRHVKGHQDITSEEAKWNNYVDDLAVKASHRIDL